MFVLDTNVISELRRLKPHGAVLSWAESVDPDLLHLAAATIGELQVGIERTRERDVAKAIEIESWLDDVLHRLVVLAMDAETFRIWAKIMHGRSRDMVGDAMIAATALRHGFTVVTRNVKDFRVFPVPLLNPFEAAR